MKEFELKYGCNPNQKPAKVFMADGSDLPFAILSGRPGYINFLDAFNSYQLVKELKEATGMPCATSFKHVSPTSAAVGSPLPEALKKACFVDDIEGLDDSPLACAYARARGTDRMSSFGDFIALSDVCDVTTAKLVKREVSDGIIAPGYEPEALEILKSKRKGNYNIIQIDPAYVPAKLEHKQVYGVTFEQGRNDFKIDAALLQNIVTKNKALPESAVRDLIVALITRCATPWTGRPSAWARGSSPASTAPGWPATRPTSGTCASTKRCWTCRSCPPWAGRSATTPSTCTFRTTTRTCSPKARGSSTLPPALRPLPKRSKRPIWPRSRAFRSAATPSSPLATTSTAPAAAA